MTGQYLRFYFDDVFAQEPLNGNPLSLVVDAQDLSKETMQRIAREFNQSETTFLLLPTRSEADWRLRSFTPTGVEVFPGLVIMRSGPGGGWPKQVGWGCRSTSHSPTVVRLLSIDAAAPSCLALEAGLPRQPLKGVAAWTRDEPGSIDSRNAEYGRGY